MYEYKIDFCAKLKTEYYIKAIKTLYNWSFDIDENLDRYIDALGMNEYKTEIISLLHNKARLDPHINYILSYLQDFTKHEDRTNSLRELKLILLVCNKTQAIKIYSIVVRTAEDLQKDLNAIETF